MMGGIFNQGRNAGQNGNPPSSGPGKFLGMTKKGWMIGIAAFLIVPMIPGLIMAGIAIKGMNDVQNVDTGQAQCQEWNTTREDFYRSSGIDIGKKAGCEDTLPELSGRVTPGPGSTPLTPVNPGTTPGVTPAPNPNNAYCDALKEQNDALPGTQFDVPLPAECK